MNASIRFPNLNLDFEFVAQSVSVRGIEIPIFSMLITLGMLVGLTVMIAVSKAKKENPNLPLETAVFCLAGAAAGARLSYAALHWSSFGTKTLEEFLDIRSGGMCVYGGILGGILFGFLFCGVRRISFAKMADIVCMGFLPGQIIGIWGCFFNRECFGEYTDSLFAMELPVSAVSESRITELMRANFVESGSAACIRVHPLFLYESLWCLLLFLVLLLYTWKKKYDGEILLRYLAGYTLGRAGIEWMKPNTPGILGTEFPLLPLVLLLLSVLFGITAAVRRSLSKKREIYKKRREEARKKAALNYEDVHNYEDVTRELMGDTPAAENQKSKENEVAEHAEADQKPETTAGDEGSKKDHPEETEKKDKEMPPEAERNDQQQGGSV